MDPAILVREQLAIVTLASLVVVALVVVALVVVALVVVPLVEAALAGSLVIALTVATGTTILIISPKQVSKKPINIMEIEITQIPRLSSLCVWLLFPPG